jgi:uncharacterized protein (TIGR02271 family)
MLTLDQIEALSGGTVTDSAGEKIGKVGQVYLDDRTGEPDWVTVNTGLFGRSESFVPLRGATTEGDALRVGYTKAQVKDAPRVDVDGHLSEDEEQRLYVHYGLADDDTGTGAGGTTGRTGADTGRDDGRGDDSGAGDADRGAAAGTGAARTGTTTDDAAASGRRDAGDDAMTLSEERLRVGTERREAGRARLRKYVVTEQETVTVPVTREEVRLEREPVTDANRDDALSGPELTESEHEVVLTEERPVVEKETVPVERVRLSTDTVTDEAQVSEEVRHEEVEAEGTEGTGGTHRA